MQIGSLVSTVGDFEDVRKEWGFNYPRKGDILTIKNLYPHINLKAAKKGILLLEFEELDLPFGICDKTYKGEINFIEVQPPMEIIIENLIEELV